jgi:hypothetical protein
VPIRTVSTKPIRCVTSGTNANEVFAKLSGPRQRRKAARNRRRADPRCRCSPRASRGVHARFFECCGEKFRPLRSTSVTSNMPSVARDADRRLALLEGPGRVVQSAGLVVALVVIGAAGLFGVAARRSEMELLFARGSRPLGVAARSSLEATSPSIAGGVLGIGLAYLLVRLAGPPGPIEAEASGPASP